MAWGLLQTFGDRKQQARGWRTPATYTLNPQPPIYTPKYQALNPQTLQALKVTLIEP